MGQEILVSLQREDLAKTGEVRLCVVPAAIYKQVFRTRPFPEAMECPICMDTIFPCEEFCESECYPLRHICHFDCYTRYILATSGRTGEPTRCPSCRQVEISELDWIHIAIIFGFHANTYVDVEQLPNEAQRYARSFQRGEITQNELCERAESS